MAKETEPEAGADKETGRYSRHLTQREEALLEIVRRRGGTAAATDIEDALGGEMHNSTVRTHLRGLVKKGCLRQTNEGGRYLYEIVPEKARNAREALRHLLLSFFGGAPVNVFEELVPMIESEEELAEIEAMVKAAKEKSSG